MKKLISSPEERHAKTSVSDIQPVQSEQEMGLTERDRRSPFVLSASPENTDPASYFGKTCRRFFQKGTRQDFSDLQDSLPSAGIISHGECWMGDISACAISHDLDFSWSDILVPEPPQKFYLSIKAIMGIAKRKRMSRLFSRQEGAWLSMTERRAFWRQTAGLE